jgi:hypothetical protein
MFETPSCMTQTSGAVFSMKESICFDSPRKIASSKMTSRKAPATPPALASVAARCTQSVFSVH